MSSQSRPRIVLIALAVLGAFVAFWRLSVPGWGVDEVTYASAGQAYLDGEFIENRGHAWLAKELIGLSMKVIGPTEIGVRLPGAVFGYLTGFLLYALGRRLSGKPMVGVVATGLWWLLPQAPGVHLLRLDRYGMLEPPMVFFAVAALLAAWIYGERGNWRLFALAALCLGLSASSKFTGALFAPAVGLPLLWAPAAVRTRAFHAAAGFLAGLAGLVGPYFAEGTAGLSALREGLSLQLDNNAEGHLQIVAGVLYSNPPPWSHLWWQAQYLSLLGTAAIWVLAAAGFVFVKAERPWRVRLLLLGATALHVASLVTSPRKLPHYHLVLVPALALAAGIAVVWAWDRRAARPFAMVALATLTVLAAIQVGRTATVEPDAYRLAARRLESDGLGEGSVLVFGWSHVLQAEMPRAEAIGGAPAELPDAIVVDPVTRDRLRGSALDRYVSSVSSGYDRSRVDRLTVYVRRDL